MNLWTEKAYFLRFVISNLRDFLFVTENPCFLYSVMLSLCFFCFCEPDSVPVFFREDISVPRSFWYRSPPPLQKKWLFYPVLYKNVTFRSGLKFSVTDSSGPDIFVTLLPHLIFICDFHISFRFRFVIQMPCFFRFCDSFPTYLHIFQNRYSKNQERRQDIHALWWSACA